MLAKLAEKKRTLNPVKRLWSLKQRNEDKNSRNTQRIVKQPPYNDKVTVVEFKTEKRTKIPETLGEV